MFYLVLFPVMTALFFGPTILWRRAIKSTAWFYIPLLWVGRGWQNLDAEGLLIWAKSYAAKWLNRIGIIVAATCLAGSIASIFMPLEFLKLSVTLENANAPFSPIGYLMVLDWAALKTQPWQWFYLPSWIITITMFLMIDAQAKDITVGGAQETSRLTKLTFWMWVGNARTVLTNIGLAIALWYFLDAVGAWDQVKTAWNSLFSA